MTINFNDREIELRFTFRADMIYENIMQKSFKAQTETEWIVYFYSTYLAITDDTDLGLDDFILKLDESPKVLYDFIQWYVDFQNNNMKLIPKEKEESKNA